MILGVIEYEQSTMTELSLQMVTFGRDLAEKSGDEFVGLIIGASDNAPLIGELGRYGVAKVITAAHENLKDYAPVAWANTISQVIDQTQAKMVMAPGSDQGNEVMAHLAARSDLPMATNCAAVSADDLSRITRLRWGSSLMEEAILTGDCKLITIAPFVVEAAEGASHAEPAEESFEPTLSDQDIQVRLIRKEPDETEGITLKNASVVVGGGRGVGSPEAYSVLEELAKLLGGAVGCSRVATNNGWRPHSDQVGLTGTRISPELYIACGISGAIQHLVGCKGAGKIMVINKDPEAAFFGKADYGVIGDLHEVLPAIIEELKAQGV
ncbi:electron transfer flavoprotein subunit alpha/FixB family protein [Desulforhopalus singaporensis]|uniref:Electron transfer flavoprotein alpha subunit n=1 Tax=Desulforhopalus singaporensis TaxID=91360 RepID=A0A1H0U320_9BACT|nr:electron transfer flavoprotein subunit alpha/FixB family protein [Desulforhopalus singaporensis]SDP60395.1 electron transfer flavoprotein alpha subunit [Desulforhopalus singaporensis]